MKIRKCRNHLSRTPDFLREPLCLFLEERIVPAENIRERGAHDDERF